MRNMKIKQDIYAAGLKLWQVAEAIGVHPTTLTVWLRYDLSAEQEAKIYGAIQSLKNKASVVSPTE